jgi:hypothetical protein
MTITGSLYRLTWGGTLFGIEEWANTMHVFSEGDLADNPAAYKDAINVFHMASTMSSAATCTFVKFNKIDPLTGHYANLTDSFTYIQVAGIVGSGSITHAQLSLACTILTNRARGRGSKGRIFPPVAQMTPDSSGYVSTSTRDALSASFKTLVNSVNAASISGRVVVFSKIQQSVTDVNAIEVGRVMDVQTRRRRSLLEAPVRVPLV